MRKSFACTLLLLLQAVLAVSQSAQAHQNRAVSLLLNQSYEDAIPELREAAALYERDGAYTRYFDCLNQLSKAYLSTGQTEAAKQTAKSSLWESMKLLGRDNPQASTAAHHLAKAYSAAGRHDDAIQFHQMGLDIRTEIYGKLHSEVVASLCELSVAEREAGQLMQAEEHLNEGLRLLSTIYHPEHAEVAQLRSLLGQLRQESGDLREARQQYETALRILERESRPGSLKGEVLLRLASLSEGEEQQALYEEALPYLSQHSLQPDEQMMQGLLRITVQALREGKAELAVRYSSYVLQSAGAESVLSPAEATFGLRLAEGLLVLGRLQEALAVFETIWEKGEIPIPETLAVASCQLSVWAGKPEQAVRWAADYEGQASAPSVSVERLTALLASGNAEAVSSQLPELRDKLSPAQLAEADYLEGRAMLQTAEPGPALVCFQRGLQQPGISVWAKARLLGAALQAHHATGEPAGDAALRALQAFQSAIGECLDSPLAPLQAQQLLQLQEEVQPAALELLYALHTARPTEIRPVYEWMEQSAFHRLFTEVHGLRKSASALRQYYQIMQDDSGGEGAGQAFPEDARYTLVDAGPLSWEAMQSVCRKDQMQPLYFQQTEDYIYCFRVEGGAGSLQRFPLLADWPQQLPNAQKGWTAIIAEELQRSAGTTERLLIIPGAGLELFPFELLAGQQGYLGETFTLLRHGSLTTYLLDANSAGVLPPATGPLAYVLGKEEVQKEGEVIAMPTRQPAVEPGENWVQNWVLEQGGRTLVGSRPPAALAFAAIDPSALHFDWPKARLTAISAEGMPRLAASLYSRLVWEQMKGAGAYLVCPSFYAGAETGRQILQQWKSGEQPLVQAARASLSATGEQQPGNAPAVVLTFGAPAGRRAGAGIPAYLVLGAVASVIFLGVWAKR